MQFVHCCLSPIGGVKVSPEGLHDDVAVRTLLISLSLSMVVGNTV